MGAAATNRAHTFGGGASMRSIARCALASILLLAAVPLLRVAQTQALPAPTVDNVHFPAGYQSSYTLLYTFDNYQNRQIRKVYGNAAAASVKPGEVFNFPYGSIV